MMQHNKKGHFTKGNKLGSGPRSLAHRILNQCFDEHLMSHYEAFVRNLFDLALSGDLGAIKLILERCMPVRKNQSVAIDDLPPADSLDGVKQGIGMLLGKMAKGEYSYDEIQPFVELYQAQSKAIENADIIPQINEIKQLMGKA